MLKFIFAILILSTTVACGSGGGGSPVAPKQAVNDSSDVAPIDSAPQDVPTAEPTAICGDYASCMSYCQTLLGASGEDPKKCATLPVSSVYVRNALPGAMCTDVVQCFRFCYKMCLGIGGGSVQLKRCKAERDQCFASRVDEVYP